MPMYRVIGPTAAVALLVLFLIGILRMLLDIVVRAVAIASVRGCGWWLLGAFWGTLFQVAVAPMRWAMEKGHGVGKTVCHQMSAEAGRIDVEMQELEAEDLNQDEPDQVPRPMGVLRNLDRFVLWSHGFARREHGDQLYPFPRDPRAPAPQGDDAPSAPV